MSIKLMTQAWDTPCQTHTQKLVLLKLADNASDEGFCFPSLSTIARKCDLSPQAVINQIRKLEAAKLVEVTRSRGRTRNHYKLLPTVNGVERSEQCQQSTALSVTVNGVERSTVNGVDTNRNCNRHSNRQEGGVAAQSAAPTDASPSSENGKKSEVQRFIGLWCEAFQEINQENYLPNWPKDGAQVKRLLNIGQKTEDLIGLARSAWKELDGFLLEQSQTISGFVSRVNEIRMKVRHGKERNGNATQEHAKAGARSPRPYDPNRW